ncbi:MAG: ABC transporter permease [Candidatus Rokubacteria bacterium RBG_16_73_20]|nr:MAG: ABC transporter permease [Candidatus Rokubacteria bacterium GWA2_73_35]OGK89456.1 MAG: ABC transporter permease [Candidatus Rokubacteria bacterium RBG_16_73_20]HBH04579.1 branched-chain amino acid ABC transporter permease [Candidatus Rokubacteria bacterium]
MDFWISQVFNGISYGALLFLLAGGLTLIFGMMRIINLTHGSYFLLGGYVGLTVIWRTGSFPLAILVGAVAIAVLGVVQWRLFLHRLAGEELGQVLTTVGFALIFQDLALVIWGGEPYTIPAPAALTGAFNTGTLYFPVYRVFMIGVAAVVAVVLWFVLERTRVGAMMRATVDDAEMAGGVGIDVRRISMGVFALGALLAAGAGVVGGAFVGVYPGADFEILPYAFVVVIVGGMGSLRGALIGSLLVGLLDNFGKALFPEFSYFTLFAPMAAILAIRPTGLFGRA